MVTLSRQCCRVPSSDGYPLPVSVGYEGQCLGVPAGGPAPELELGQVVHEEVELGGEGVVDRLVDQLRKPGTG